VQLTCSGWPLKASEEALSAEHVERCEGDAISACSWPRHQVGVGSQVRETPSEQPLNDDALGCVNREAPVLEVFLVLFQSGFERIEGPQRLTSRRLSNDQTVAGQAHGDAPGCEIALSLGCRPKAGTLDALVRYQPCPELDMAP
jgi:hypothetical protein